MPIELTLLSGVRYRGQEITSPRLRALLALLAADVRTGSSTARLAEGIWHDESPDNPAKALQILISRVRSQLGADVIETTPTGYRLNLQEDQVDACAALRRASTSAQLSRAGDHAAALREAEAGLALWDGTPADDGLLDDPVAALRAERISTYRSLARARALVLARLGRHDEALEPLIELFHGRPRDEELLRELLRSEAATAGAAAALTRYEKYRSTLRDELGADPGQGLQATYQELLRDTAPLVRHGLSHEPNPLLGRDDDIAAVEQLLHSSRVTSIVGPGGLGKTRLAHAVWRQAEQRVGFFVALAGVTRDDEVIGEVATAVGAGESGRPQAGVYTHDLRSAIAAAIGAGPALLVLDNCEHVLHGVADLVQSLVSMTEDLRILTTSRAPLGLSSESVYLLPELPLSTMVELFDQRARAARPDVGLPPDVVEEICRQLDGLPLGVELAAARVRVMSVPQIARRLDDRFNLLRGGPRDAPERHRTLHAVVEWSWNLLEQPAQQAMRTLSVFPSGFTADAAEQMLGGDVLEVLEQLVEQSLLTVTDSAIGTRFRMLETVREFCTAERCAKGVEDEVHGRLLTWARELGMTYYEAPFGPDPFPAVDTIRAEHDNLGYALRQAVAREEAPTVAAVAAVLGYLWLIDSNFPRMSSLVEETSRLLSHYRPEQDNVEITRAALALSAGYTFMIEGPQPIRALVALRRLPAGSPATMAGCVSIIFDAVLDSFDALLALSDSDEPALAATANTIASYYWENVGEIDNALAAARRTLGAAERANVPVLEGMSHTRVGELYFQLERAGDAREHLVAGLSVVERLGSRANAIGLRWSIVLANLQLGDIDEAERWMGSGDGSRVDKLGALGYDLGARAEVLLARGDVDAGLRLWRQVIAMLRSTQDQFSLAIPLEMDQWAVEARTVAVVAHAHHRRLDHVLDLREELAERLSSLLHHPIANPPPYVMEFQLAGSMMLAIALVELHKARRDADSSSIGAAVRMIALAERLGYFRNFQPTMASARVRQIAEGADRSAYGEAVNSYADLDRDGLRAAAIVMFRP